jgi:Transposase DDE domain
MADIVMGAFSVFFLQAPSFLSHQKMLEEREDTSNAETLFEIMNIPTDSQIRSVLDRVDPKSIDGWFRSSFETLEDSHAMEKFRVLGDRILIALDGTQHHSSQKVFCDECKVTNHSNGDTIYSHGFVGASLVSPGNKHVLSLEPEFIVPQDGHEKQDCENAAAKRWLETYGPYYKTKKAILCGDDLYASTPVCKAVSAQGLDFVFVAKETSHSALYQHIYESSTVKTVTVADNDKTTVYRYANNVNLTADANSIAVNWAEIEVYDSSGAITYHNAWITSLPVCSETVVEIVACGRARWKVENETFNTLKTAGYNLEHNFGHGKKHLSNMLATLNLCAFVLHTICDLLSDAYREINERIARRKGFFEEVRTIVRYHVYKSWGDLFTAMLRTFRERQPRQRERKPRVLKPRDST